LHDLDDPAPHYRTIGRWSALFHDHAGNWPLSAGLKRFAWDLDDMVRPSFG
jgi:hypothetical protein